MTTVARAKVRAKAQLTVPDEIRRALHIGEGDEVEFTVHDDGTVTVRGFVSIPTDQMWFWTPEWQAGEGQAEADIAAGRKTFHRSAEDMFAHLDSIEGRASSRRGAHHLAQDRHPPHLHPAAWPIDCPTH